MAKKKQALNSAELLAEALVREEDWPYAVPGNWVWTRLGSVTTIIGGGTPSSNVSEYYENGNIPWISPADLSHYTNIYISHGRKNITELGLKKSSARLMPRNTVMLSSRAPIGYVVIAENEIATNQGFKSFLPSSCYLSKYLYFYLKNNKELLESYASGTTFLELSGKNAALVEFPLPPLAEQQRIVDRIESLFDQLDQAKDLIQAALDSFENRKAAILYQAFTGQLTKKWRAAHGVGMESWEETKSESIFEYVTSGSRGWAQYYDTKGSVFIRMGNLDHGTIELDLADIQYVKLPENVEGKRSKVEKNDVLISITADVGMVGLVRNENMDAYINQHVALARPEKSVNAEFIAWFLVSDIGLHQLQSLQRGVTKIGLTLGDIRNLTIKLPSLSEQTEIVRILDDLLAKEQNAKDLCDLIDQIEAIKKTILGKAFRGELGTNQAGEASALALLQQVLSQQDQAN